MTQINKNIDLSHPILLFDGVCNFCNDTVNFIIKRDPEAKFRFAALQSDVGQDLLKKHNLPTDDFESVILIHQNKVYLQSDVTVKILENLGGWWSVLAIYKFVPRFIRDTVYDFIAKNRYNWFGKKETCMIPTPDIKERFLG